VLIGFLFTPKLPARPLSERHEVTAEADASAVEEASAV
jgi:hypothetical protein